jgi:hypothetical protein
VSYGSRPGAPSSNARGNRAPFNWTSPCGFDDLARARLGDGVGERLSFKDMDNRGCQLTFSCVYVLGVVA